MELDDIMMESIKNLEQEFYDKEFSFSYSSLNKLIWNPQAFYQMYIMGIREEKTDAHLINGKVIHSLLLEEDKFNDQFIISPNNLPTANTKSVIDRVYGHYEELHKNGDSRVELEDYSNAVLDVLKDMSLHQTLKTDQQRIDKIVTEETKEYWGFLKKRGGKILIDQQTYDYCKASVDVFKQNKEVCKLLWCNPTEFDNVEVYNEMPLNCKVINMPFNLKGIVDNIVINHDEKIVYINDVKTSSKDLKDFPESIEFYSYWMQAAIYISLVITTFDKYVQKGYSVVFNFIVIDKNLQVYPFKVSERTFTAWLDRLEECLNKAKWHYINKSFNLPYDFANGKIVL
jgi:hypothetical protein